MGLEIALNTIGIKNTWSNDNNKNNNGLKQEIKKDKATLHVISKIYEDTVIIPVKLEGNPLMLTYIEQGLQMNNI